MPRTVLITGGGSGIGRAAAIRFAREGAFRVVITGRTPSRLQETLSLIRDIPGAASAEAFVSDISSEESVREMMKAAGSVDILINNAGDDLYGLLQDTSLSEWERIHAVNLTGTFLTMREAIPMMLRSHSGSIVNVSSVYGLSGGAMEAAYSSSKGGVIALTKAMAKELAPSGIRVNAAAFGAIDTAMNDRLSDEEKKALCGEIPLGRMGTAEEAADLIYNIAVTYTYMTGQVITLDGGWTV